MGYVIMYYCSFKDDYYDFRKSFYSIVVHDAQWVPLTRLTSKLVVE